ncbi:Maf family protein [Aliikangiella sp. IMCC44359]|uniref:Maf family protein n=1 Tax=Aliikangiella sp. IMCC44359 TaxID=3459125 RepID=UPI00403AE0C2
MNPLYPHYITLASRSPRRQELLRQIGVEFQLLDLAINESVSSNELPLDYVQRMAQEKAKTGWSLLQQQKISTSHKNAVLAADTCVVLRDNILGKPKDLDDSIAIIRLLSGNVHQVMTSVSLINEDGISTQTSITDVEFAKLTNQQIVCYCQSGEGMDKAGSYAIQGFAAQFVKSIKGSYSGVVGLPLYETSLLLNKHFKVDS